MKFYKIIILFLFILIFLPSGYGLTITHPQTDTLTTDESGIFFSGNIEKFEKIYINGTPIIPQKKRAFSKSFPLQIGENIFAVQSHDLLGKTKTLKYHILRLNPTVQSNKFVPKEQQYYSIKNNIAVLRSTPIDAGMNRLGYLPENTKVLSDGEQNNFSRIILSEENYGWIKTKDLIQNDIKYAPTSENQVQFYTPKYISLLSENEIKTSTETTFTFNLSENAPYSAIVDNDKLCITIYNLDTNDGYLIKEIPLNKFPRYTVCMQNGVLYSIIKNPPVNNSNYSNKLVKIIIDPGHGGKENGAIGCLGDKEKDINLEVALKLKKILENSHFKVYLTRENDKNVSLEDRINFAKNKDALIFLSIHLNAVPISSNPNLNEGSVVFYFNPQSEELAKCISKSLSQKLKTKNGGAVQASFAVIRPTEYIGVLAELAYMINPQDISIYKSKNFSQHAAIALYQGLVEYIFSEL